jgi:hypothetical protein
MSKKLISGTIYSLNQEEQSLILNMAAEICNQDRSLFINKYKIDKSMSLMDMNKNGFGAELAFCKLCDVDFDSSTIKEENHFSRADAKFIDGTEIDVKTTIYDYGKLLVRGGKEKKIVDIYVLMTGNFPNYVFKGWTTYTEMIRPENIERLNWGFTYAMKQKRLRKDLDIPAPAPKNIVWGEFKQLELFS